MCDGSALLYHVSKVWRVLVQRNKIEKTSLNSDLYLLNFITAGLAMILNSDLVIRDHDVRPSLN